MASFGTSASSVRRSALTKYGLTPSTTSLACVSVSSRISIFKLGTSDTASAAAALLAGAVVRDGRDVFDASDHDAVAGEATDGRLGAGAGAAGLVAAVAAHADVERHEALLLDLLGDLLRDGHGGERATLVLVGLDHHAARALGDRLGAGGVGDRDQDVVVAGEDVADALLVVSHQLSPPLAAAEAAMASLMDMGAAASACGALSKPAALGRTGWFSSAMAFFGSMRMDSSSPRRTT